MGTTNHDAAREAGRLEALAYFQAEAAKLVATLNERERRVLRMIGQGFCNREIASALDISTTTAWEARTSMFAKLGVSSSPEACVIAAKGLLL